MFRRSSFQILRWGEENPWSVNHYRCSSLVINKFSLYPLYGTGTKGTGVSRTSKSRKIKAMIYFGEIFTLTEQFEGLKCLFVTLCFALVHYFIRSNKLRNLIVETWDHFQVLCYNYYININIPVDPCEDLVLQSNNF